MRQYGTLVAILLAGVLVGLVVSLLTSTTAPRPYRLQPTRECGHGLVTTTCPFISRALDRQYLGEPIIEVEGQ